MNQVTTRTEGRAFELKPNKGLQKYRPYWAKRYGVAPFLPTTRQQMDALGWDSCDVILVTGDAYIDHPSFGMALIGRLLEDQGFRVGILSQPEWTDKQAFMALGRPNLFFGVTAGNMDSMVNRYTADKRPRSDDAYTPDADPSRRPDRAVSVYAQRVREAFPGVGVIIGGIEASLRRIAQYDYWSDKVRQSALLSSKADLLLFGNSERAIIEVAHRVAKGEPISTIRDVRGTAFIAPYGWRPQNDWVEVDSTTVDLPGKVQTEKNPYDVDMPDATATGAVCSSGGEGAAKTEPDSDLNSGSGPDSVSATTTAAPAAMVEKKIVMLSRRDRALMRDQKRLQTVVRLPAYEAVAFDPVLYAHASRVFHLESNPGNARAMVQQHGERDVWLNIPPEPLTTPEMDYVYDLPYARNPHPMYQEAKIPAWEMIKFSVNIMRGCFGGCTFCSITEHEGRIIQSRSHESILTEIEAIRDKTEGFTGQISDLGGPTANMYRLACKDEITQASCRQLSCVYPVICKHLNTDHSSLIELYRKARAVKGVKKINIQSGLRYDLAVESPEYVRELVKYHVGGYLKIAPEHTEEGPLSMMMKPGMGSYDRFKQMFEQFSKEAGKEQYLIPYFIAAHPGTTDHDMLNLALWLKKNKFRLDQVQTFLPTPMAMATTMWHTQRNPLGKLSRSSPKVEVVRHAHQRRLHKAFLRYHDPKNWAIIREALVKMGRRDLIGPAAHQLVPLHDPVGVVAFDKGRDNKARDNKARSQTPQIVGKGKSAEATRSGSNRVGFGGGVVGGVVGSQHSKSSQRTKQERIGFGAHELNHLVPAIKKVKAKRQK